MGFSSRDRSSSETSLDELNGDGGEIVAEINITPLVDVFLVLLIIFMVTSSVMTSLGVEVTLPKASGVVSQSDPEGVVVTLLPTGALRVMEVNIPPEDTTAFENTLREAWKKTRSRLVVLEGDQKAFLGSVISVMDHARKAGAEKFAIATEGAK